MVEMTAVFPLAGTGPAAATRAPSASVTVQFRKGLLGAASRPRIPQHSSRISVPSGPEEHATSTVFSSMRSAGCHSSHILPARPP
jgi:hypothetical protein